MNNKCQAWWSVGRMFKEASDLTKDLSIKKTGFCCNLSQQGDS